MRWGFEHEAGPFETWDMLGVAETVKRMKTAGYPPANWVEEMLKAGMETFYQYKDGVKVGVYDVSRKKYVKLKRPCRDGRAEHPEGHEEGHQPEQRRHAL